jgi:hypothetical protein
MPAGPVAHLAPWDPIGIHRDCSWATVTTSLRRAIAPKKTLPCGSVLKIATVRSCCRSAKAVQCGHCREVSPPIATCQVGCSTCMVERGSTE